MLKKSMLLGVVAAGLMATSAGSAPAYSAKGGFSLHLRGFVPVICRASVDATQVTPQEGVVDIGTMNEFCNSPNGYEVWADYSESLSEAAIVVDGESIDLSEAGTTRISASSHAGIARRTLALDLPSDATGGSLSIRVVAL